jgi:RNA polymerase sigma-70 factor (ECF subfamily)
VEHDEAKLIALCQEGDQKALKEIFDLHHKKVYRVAFGMVRHREDAMDIVQDVFIKLFRSIKEFKGESRLSTYLYRMTVNTSIDHIRKMGKPGHNRALEDEEGFQPAEDGEKRPDRIFLYKELEGKVNEALSQIPSDQRTAIVLREVEGLSYEEIAKTMKCSIGTIMSRLHYGRKKMQEFLKGYVRQEIHP